MKYFFSIILLAFLSCMTETEINTNVTSQLLPNNKLIEVLKKEITATQTGVFTRTNYSSTYSFEYQFTINKNEIIWKDKGSAIPKKIVFCKDTTYIKYLHKKSIAYQQIHSDTINITKYRDTIVKKHEAFIDNRYFFKLFGDSFWTTITESKYNAKKTKCNEYDIPNDNDFKLIYQEGTNEKKTSMKE